MECYSSKKGNGLHLVPLNATRVVYTSSYSQCCGSGNKAAKACTKLRCSKIVLLT